MLQAFVSLQQQQPPRTDSGLKSFFQGLVEASFSPPTYYCTNLAPEPQGFSIPSVSAACMDENCKWVQMRGEKPYFWQATLLLPDKGGNSAMFYHFEDEDGSKPVIDNEDLVGFAKKFYNKLEPRLIRMGDSEAREKLKSRHGLVLMPGLGRVEWVQVVHPDVYSGLYNSSELAAAPAYATEIMPNAALYLRVYGDPKDWDSEENISLANFIPGFLAGTANVTDGEKAKQAVRQIEKMWTRASKTAGKIAEIFHPPEEPPAAVEEPEVDATVKMSSPPADLFQDTGKKAAEPEDPPSIDAPVIAAEPIAEHAPPTASEVKAMLPAVAPSVKLEGNISSVSSNFQMPLFRGRDATDSPASDFYLAFDTEEGGLKYLDRPKDFAAFLHREGLKIEAADVDQIVGYTKTYHRPYLKHLNSITDVPGNAGMDPRLSTFKERCRAPHIESDGETQKLHIWAFNPRASSLEELTLHQLEGWTLNMESKSHVVDLKAPEVKSEDLPSVSANTGFDTGSGGSDLASATGGKKSKTLIYVIILIIVLGAAAAVYFLYLKDT